MKHKSTHIGWLIICIIIAGGAFIAGMIYGEKAEKRRITEGFVKVFQEQFGPGSVGTGNANGTGVIN